MDGRIVVPAGPARQGQRPSARIARTELSDPPASTSASKPRWSAAHRRRCRRGSVARVHRRARSGPADERELLRDRPAARDGRSDVDGLRRHRSTARSHDRGDQREGQDRGTDERESEAQHDEALASPSLGGRRSWPRRGQAGTRSSVGPGDCTDVEPTYPIRTARAGTHRSGWSTPDVHLGRAP